MREYGIERAVRDARLGPIGGGTDEIMKEILGRQWACRDLHRIRCTNGSRPQRAPILSSGPGAITRFRLHAIS